MKTELPNADLNVKGLTLRQINKKYPFKYVMVSREIDELFIYTQAQMQDLYNDFEEEVKEYNAA